MRGARSANLIAHGPKCQGIGKRDRRYQAGESLFVSYFVSCLPYELYMMFFAECTETT